MKKCTRCGALQDDGRTVCLDCGEHLPPPLSEGERIKAETELVKKIENLSDRADNSYVSKPKKVFIIFDVLGMAISIYFCAAFFYGTPDAVICLYTLIFSLLSAAIKVFPHFFWNIEKFRLSFMINEADTATPTDIWIIGNNIAGYGLTIFNYILFIYICFSI